MFTNKNHKKMNKSSDQNSSINMIGKGTTINGDIDCKGDIRIDGVLKGSVITGGKIVIGPSGVVEGDITCGNADVSGEINAKITVSHTLSMKSTSKLNGDIVTDKLSIEPGATFSGSCSMGAVIKDIKNVEKQERKEKSA